MNTTGSEDSAERYVAKISERIEMHSTTKRNTVLRSVEDSMTDSQPVLRNISDTALWVAIYRALESERPDALFRDPFARRLAGERGAEMRERIRDAKKTDWAFVARTVAFDEAVQKCVAAGADLVVNLAAGLDTRPYRMSLPASLRWVEVDLPDLVAYKEQVLAGETPVCRLERVPLDLADVPARRELFARLGREASRALVVSEGLIIYLATAEVASLARDLAAAPGFRWWANDPVSPALLRRLNKSFGESLGQAGAPLRFALAEGFGFFEPYGWRLVDARSLLRTAARLKRVGWLYRLLARLPDRYDPRRPWGGVCLFERSG